MERICGHCGNELKKNESKCPKCKNYVGEEEIVEEPEKEINNVKHSNCRNKRNGIFSTLAVLLAIVLMMVPIILAFVLEDEDIKPGITMIDFSNMDMETARLNCDNNNIKCSFIQEYSSSIPEGKFISQSIKANTNNVNPDATVTIKFSLGKNLNKDDNEEILDEEQVLSEERRQALDAAKEEMDMYDDNTYYGLINELERSFSKETAKYAADNIDVNWNNLALKYAREIMDDDYSYYDLKDELVDEFTNNQALYALGKVADWNAVAVKRAREYLEDYDYTYQEMVDELESDGFTNEQAVYAAKKVIR